MGAHLHFRGGPLAVARWMGGAGLGAGRPVRKLRRSLRDASSEPRPGEDGTEKRE